MERRGFIGAMLTGAAALAAKPAEKAITEVESKFLVPENVAEELQKAKDGSVLFTDNMDNPEIKKLGALDFCGLSDGMMHILSPHERNDFIKAHLDVNRHFGVDTAFRWYQHRWEV